MLRWLGLACASRGSNFDLSSSYLCRELLYSVGTLLALTKILTHARVITESCVLFRCRFSTARRRAQTARLTAHRESIEPSRRPHQDRSDG